MRLKISKQVRPDLHDEIRALTDLGFHGVSDVGVEVHIRARQRGISEASKISGMAYDSAHGGMLRCAKTSKYLITVLMAGDPERLVYPRDWHYPDLKTAPDVVFQSWQQEFLHTIAHEAKHIYQYRGKRSRSEVTAERWALKVLDGYRALGTV